MCRTDRSHTPTVLPSPYALIRTVGFAISRSSRELLAADLGGVHLQDIDALAGAEEKAKWVRRYESILVKKETVQPA